ncbi:hypothetical protein JL721_12890 [Aureococcus anophagefferens]|nr:hypothetical protein JL721_12890 [Aureococcus anophagefferens]
MASNVGAFLALPPQIFLVLFLVFLNSFQGFGIRFVRYQYLTNEYGFSDKAAASLLGVQATLNLFFAGVGAVLTDAVGVRRRAMVAMSRLELYASFLVLAPVGEALLSVGIYRVSLKKLTTPRTRAFAFAVEYATFNLSGALADVLIDALRRRPGARDRRRDTVTDADDPEEGAAPAAVAEAARATLAAPGRRAWLAWRRETRRYVVSPTRPKAFVAPGTAPASRVEAALAQLRRVAAEAATTLRSRRLWRVFVASLAVFGVAKQWSESEQLMPPFLERRYGEKVPIFTIHSINLWGCLIFPTLVAAKTSDLPAFRVIVPGLWIMALSPLALVASPTPAGAATGVCDAPAGGWETSAAGRAVCPATCLECASYSDPNPRTLWTVVLLLSLTSPMIDETGLLEAPKADAAGVA